MDSEVNRLKAKVNMQIDALLEKDQEIENLKKQLETLKLASVSKKEEQEDVLKQSSSNIDSARTESMKPEIFNFFNKFCIVVKKLHETDKFIPYKNTTKYSNSFFKVAKSVFEAYVNEVAGETAPDFFQMSMDFLCIKSEAGKAVYNNDRLRVYYLNKKLVLAILGVDEEASDCETGKKVI